jgi:hypothetical protein
VLPGSVEVRATYESKTESRLVDVEAGGARAVELELVEVASPPPPPLIVEEDVPVTKKWWFWTAIVGGVVAVGTAAAVVAATSGDDFRPMGELGTTPLSDWRKQ